jgi:hypothetical protein
MEESQAIKLQQSDDMICNSTAYNAYQWRKQNDMIFYKQMDTPQNTYLMDRCVENNMRRGFSRECEVSKRIFERGGNSTNCEPVHFARGFQNYNNYHLGEYMIAPCPDNTWKNWLVQDNKKICTKRHQFYMNVTKRKEISDLDRFDDDPQKLFDCGCAKVNAASQG